MIGNYVRGTCAGDVWDLGRIEAVLFVISRFGVEFLTLLGPSWDRLGVLLGLLGFFQSRVVTKWEPSSSSLLRF